MDGVFKSIHVQEFLAVKFGMDNKDAQAQTSGANQNALTALTAGANGTNTTGEFAEMYNLLVEIRATLVANGMMKGGA